MDIGLLPSSPTLRQRLDAKAGDVRLRAADDRDAAGRQQVQLPHRGTTRRSSSTPGRILADTRQVSWHRAGHVEQDAEQQVRIASSATPPQWRLTALAGRPSSGRRQSCPATPGVPRCRPSRPGRNPADGTHRHPQGVRPPRASPCELRSCPLTATRAARWPGHS